MKIPDNQPNVTLETRGIYKQFGNVIANNDIDFTLFEGEIHALLGENGAGKTTFVNILYGLYNSDKGDIFINGEKVVLKSSRNAIKHGIGMVHQNFMLIGPFTVAENICLGAWEKGVFFINKKKLRQQIEETTSHFGLEYDLGAITSELPVGVRQRVEIVKSLFKGARILILDEPTAVLTPQETRKLFESMQELKKQGISIIFISHKLDEVLEISDRITVFRNGKEVGTVIKTQTDKKQLAKMMIGRDLAICPRTPRKKERDKIKVANLSVADSYGMKKLDRISFRVESGQILGFAGIDGNGQMELANTISGIIPADEGEIFIDGTLIPANEMTPNLFSEMGGVYIPQDRFRTGVVPEFQVYENMVLKDFEKETNNKWGFLQFENIKKKAMGLVKKFDIRPPDIELITRKLSGGNLQKVILARELSEKPSIVIASYPTRGLDIGATEFVHQQLCSQREAGVSILLFSNELDELLYLSDLIAVLHRGSIIDVIEPSKTTAEAIGLLMLGHKEKSND